MIYDLGEGRDDVADYVTVPAGTYVCSVAEVATGQTRAGDARWGLRLVVAEGEFLGRLAAWDGLVFSDRGRDRLRMVLGALGLPNQGRIELDPEDLIGRRALVEVEPREYEPPNGGRRVRRNEVPYDGYQPLPAPGPRLAGPGDSPKDSDTTSSSADDDDEPGLAMPF